MENQDNKMKYKITKIFRRLESLWYYDLIDKRGKHRRHIFKSNKGRVRAFLKKESNKEVLESDK